MWIFSILGFGILASRHFGDFEISEVGNHGILEYWTLGTWNADILNFWTCGIWECWNFEHLGAGKFEIWEFGNVGNVEFGC